MYALTVLLVIAGDHSVQPGTLFSTPAELLSREQVRRYLAAPHGWSKCPLGYSVYTTSAPDGSRIIVPGVIVVGERRPNRKFPDYKVEFSRAQVEDFAKSIVDEKERVEEAAVTELQALTHDIRALSAEISAAGELVKSDLADRQHAAAQYRIETVLAAQQILSIRLDIVDFSTGQFYEQSPERIPVYKKVHKVVNCLRPRSVAMETPINLQGPSSAFTFGPPLIELIPFVLIQNAIKYAPKRTDIVVKVSDFEDRVDFHVQSFGPNIRSTEVNRIFDRGYRGLDARETGQTGSGLGLYAALVLTHESFGGSIRVAQDSFPSKFGGRDYYRTTFSVSVPRIL